MKMRSFLMISLASSLLFTGCDSTEEQDSMQWTADGLPQSNTTIMAPGGKADRLGWPDTFEQFLEYVYCEDDGRVCVVDGDTPITGGMAGLLTFYEKHIDQTQSQNQLQQGLSVNWGKRGDDLWYGDQRLHLSFCISDDFGEDKQLVIDAMLGAVADWEEIADVKFPYRDDQDYRCHIDNRQVLFPVHPADADAPYFARAFFPQSTTAERDVRINISEYFAAQQDESMNALSLRGIMRHELGHVLGFRHEHTRQEADVYWCFEDNNYRPGTTYDSRSVMHYPQCDGENDWDLQFSDFDALGANYFYPPEGLAVLGRCDEEVDAEGNVSEDCEVVARQITEWISQYGTVEVLDEWMGLREELWQPVQDAVVDRPFADFDDLKERGQFTDDDIFQVYDYLFSWGRCPDLEVDEDGWVMPYCFPVINRILELANHSSFTVLDEDVGLDIRAVENIVSAREYRIIDTYDALIGLGYVKQVALYSLYDFLYGSQ